MGVSPPFLPNLLEFSLFCNSPFQPSGPFCSPFSCDYRPPEKVSAKLWPGLCLYRVLPWEPTRPTGRAACRALLSDSFVMQSVTRSKPATILGNVARSIIAVWTDFMMKDTFFNLREREREKQGQQRDLALVLLCTPEWLCQCLDLGRVRVLSNHSPSPM